MDGCSKQKEQVMEKKKYKPFPLFLVSRHDSIDGAKAYKVKGHRNGEREARCGLVLTGV